MVNRCNELIRRLDDSGIDGALITSPVNYRYFSGFTGTNADLLITSKQRLFFTDFRYTIQAAQQSKGSFEIRMTTKGREFDELSNAVKSARIRRLGFEEASVTVKEYAQLQQLKVELVPISDIINSIRLIKNSDEIQAIIRAQNCSDAAFAETMAFIKPGISEKDLVAELEYRLKKHGADEPSFGTIIASGENSALCHAVPGPRKLQHGDMLVMDFGSRIDGYCSDMTRTLAIGDPGAKLREIYKIVLEAQLLTLEHVKPGVSCKALDAVARDYISARGYADNFGHGLGHGFGLEIHEAPTANSYSTDVLQPGMTITVEPGIYVEGLGGVRIEDCCVVTEQGKLNLVSSAKEMLIIE